MLILFTEYSPINPECPKKIIPSLSTTQATYTPVLFLIYMYVTYLWPFFSFLSPPHNPPPPFPPLSSLNPPSLFSKKKPPPLFSKWRSKKKPRAKAQVQIFHQQLLPTDLLVEFSPAEAPANEEGATGPSTDACTVVQSLKVLCNGPPSSFRESDI